MRKPFDTKDPVAYEGRQVDLDDGIAFEESYSERHTGILERVGELRAHSKFLVSLLVLVFVLALGRLYYLSVIEHDYFKAIADDNRLRIEFLSAPRGAIYDRNGEVIAGNRPSFELVVLPLDLPEDTLERTAVVSKVSEIVQIPAAEIEALISQQRILEFQSILVKQNLDRDKALVFFEQENTLPGFQVVNTPIRDYVNPFGYAHLLGYVGKINPEEYEEKASSGYLFNDTIGKTGLEAQYEDFLRGIFGERQVEVDARGVVKKIYGEKEHLPGSNLVLNIDAGLQDALYQALTTRLRAVGKTRAAVIAMNPKNGRVLAYISLPGYNINEFAEGISQPEYQRLLADKNQPLFNRAIRGVYPPGSTVKPMVATAALQEQVVTEKTVIEDKGFIVIENVFGGPDSFFYGFNRKALGRVTVREAISESSDVYFYIVGGGYEPSEIDGLGINRLAGYYDQFRIGEVLGIDLDGERPGLVPTPEWKLQRYPDDPDQARWYLGNTYHAAIGQGDVLASPLHVLSWTATIANGGVVYKPFVVDRVEDNDGNVIEEFGSEVIGTVSVDPQYFRIVKEGMKEAAVSGTAASLATLPIEVAGKTGSAQFDASNLNRSHAWFAGFAPYDDPEIAIVVLVEDGGIGASTAVPVAKEGFRFWAENR